MSLISADSISDRRDKIALVAKELEKFPQVDCPVTHRFTDGCYLREIFMPKDTIIIGKIHATEHFNIILKGDVTVITAEGQERHQAPYTFVSGAGVQKVVYMHTDCVWQTVHVTESTDLDQIEKEVIVENYDQLKIDSLLDKAKRLVS
jgi:hypothetical protein